MTKAQRLDLRIAGDDVEQALVLFERAAQRLSQARAHHRTLLDEILNTDSDAEAQQEAV